jgi:hypothetical protein
LLAHCRANAFDVLPRFHFAGSYRNGMTLTFTIRRPRRRGQGCRIRIFHHELVSAASLVPDGAKPRAKTGRECYFAWGCFADFELRGEAAVMMDCCQCPIHPQLKSVFTDYARKNSEIVRAHRATPIFFMSWAYADKTEMTAQLAEAFTVAGNANSTDVRCWKAVGPQRNIARPQRMGPGLRRDDGGSEKPHAFCVAASCCRSGALLVGMATRPAAGDAERRRSLVVFHDPGHHCLAFALECRAVLDHECLRSAQAIDVAVDLRHPRTRYHVPAAVTVRTQKPHPARSAWDAGFSSGRYSRISPG